MKKLNAYNSNKFDAKVLEKLLDQVLRGDGCTTLDVQDQRYRVHIQSKGEGRAEIVLWKKNVCEPYV